MYSLNNLLNIIIEINERNKDIDDQIFKLNILEEEDYSHDFLYDSDDDFDNAFEQLKKNIPLIKWREHVKKSTNWINSTEQLYEIKDDGNCFYTSFAVLHYADKDQSLRVREEIVKYMMKMSFGDKYAENYQNYYEDFINGNKIPELLTNKDVNELWSSGIDAFVEDTKAPLNVKVAYVIADTMHGLRPIDIVSWADNIIIPTFASLLYEVNICIYQIERDDDDFKTYDCTIDFGSLIKYNKDKKVYKLIFYNKGLNNHFDAIIKK